MTVCDELLWSPTHCAKAHNGWGTRQGRCGVSDQLVGGWPVAMGFCGLPPIVQSTHNGWGTRLLWFPTHCAKAHDGWGTRRGRSGVSELSVGGWPVAMGFCGLPPIVQSTHNGWGTRLLWFPTHCAKAHDGWGTRRGRSGVSDLNYSISWNRFSPSSSAGPVA